MQRTEGNAGVVFDDRLGAVAVVYIPIQNADALNAGLGEGVVSGDRGI